MGKVSLDPYLFFEGHAKEAMEFYKGIFGGKLDISSFGDMPGTDAADKDKIMHAKLSGGEVTLMASDSDKASPEAKKIELSLSGTDEPKLKKFFEQLSEGGKITLPLGKQSWGDTFGMVTDKYNIAWMVNIATDKE